MSEPRDVRFRAFVLSAAVIASCSSPTPPQADPNYWAFVPVTALKGGRFVLEPAAPYKSRFRLVTFDGNADATVLNRIYDDYATPPTVAVRP